MFRPQHCTVSSPASRQRQLVQYSVDPLEGSVCPWHINCESTAVLISHRDSRFKTPLWTLKCSLDVTTSTEGEAERGPSFSTIGHNLRTRVLRGFDIKWSVINSFAVFTRQINDNYSCLFIRVSSILTSQYTFSHTI